MKRILSVTVVQKAQVIVSFLCFEGWLTTRCENGQARPFLYRNFLFLCYLIVNRAGGLYGRVRTQWGLYKYQARLIRFVIWQNPTWNNAPINSKLHHLPRATPRAFELLKIGSFKFPAPWVKIAFKCPTLVQDLTVKCPSQRTNV